MPELTIINENEREYLYIGDLQLQLEEEVILENKHDLKILIDADNNNILLDTGTYDPYISFQLNNLEKKHISFIELTYKNSTSGSLQIFYDYGQGYSQENSYLIQIDASDNSETIQIPVIGSDKDKLLNVRIDPPNGTEFIIYDAKIITNKY